MITLSRVVTVKKLIKFVNLLFFMVLIKSISGVRGIIYEDDTKGLSSQEIKQCVNKFIDFTISSVKKDHNQITIVVGRDGRLSGQRISTFIISILINQSINVIDLGLTTTPSVQMAIDSEACSGGIMVSASHNPGNWNGLKLLNFKGEFLSKKEGDEVFNHELSNSCNTIKGTKGSIRYFDYKEKHINSIMNLVDVDLDAIKKKQFKIVVDGINSSGGVYVPLLLKKMGVCVVELNCQPNGNFAHNPEPTPANLQDLSIKVRENHADLGIAVDPDVDRLVIVCEDGSFFGEEYTIVAIAKYVLSRYKDASVVSNLSTTRGVKDIALKIGAKHFESPVGEINVVEKMKQTNSIIGGEGSGGVIFALSHYGRDALVGIALFLSFLSEKSQSVKQLKLSLPYYHMLKDKIEISNDVEFNYQQFLNNKINYLKYNNQKFSLIDGLKIYYDCGSWAHIRTSNTEPLVRIITESINAKKALEIKNQLTNEINNYLK